MRKSWQLQRKKVRLQSLSWLLLRVSLQNNFLKIPCWVTQELLWQKDEGLPLQRSKRCKKQEFILQIPLKTSPFFSILFLARAERVFASAPSAKPTAYPNFASAKHSLKLYS